MALNVAQTAVTVAVNGPGRRFTVWLQGCRRGCPGCFNPELQPFRPVRAVTPAELAEELASAGPVDGVTLSGGEPFEQAAELATFLDAARRRQRTLTALAFTGHLREELRAGPRAWQALLGRLDLLVDGPYREHEAAQLPLRGSANQRLIPLSPAGEAMLREVLRAPSTGFQILVGDDGDVILTGFPPEAAVRALTAIRARPPRS